MRVYYKIEPKDVVKMIAEKYGVKNPEEKIVAVYDNCYMVDMSDTEGYDRADEDNIPESCEKDAKGEAKTMESGACADNPAERTAEDAEKVYSTITDERLSNMLDEGKSIVDICKLHGLDKRFQYRLYKRAEKLRSECASKRNADR